jgi:hypothetical protein
VTRRPGTKVVHAGLPPAEPGTPFLGGPVLAAPFHLPGDPAQSAFGYGRYDNPTWAAYERALAELDDDERRQLVDLLSRASRRFTSGGGWVPAKA